MKVSVIVTTHNTENYLKKCLDSIVNQTLQEIEIIIIDDASTDNTFDVASSYADRYDNIYFRRIKESCGPGGARNRAFLDTQA